MTETRAVKVVRDQGNLTKLLELAKPRFSGVAQKYLSSDRLVQLALVAASRNPDLYECTTGSLLGALMTSCQLGLDCTGVNGQAWLVPFNNKELRAKEAVFVPGYRGLITLVKRCGAARKIEARLVYEGDVFHVFYGSNSRIEHIPAWKSRRPEDVTYAYAVATLPDGQIQFEVMTRDELESVRRRAKSQSGPWRTDTGEMYRKTPVRRLIKYLPLDTEHANSLIGQALEADNRTMRDVEARELSMDAIELDAPQREETREPGQDDEEARDPEQSELDLERAR